MRNPFRSEAEAFRFVWLTIGYFALIVIASLINRWLGVAVFVVLTAVVAWWLFSHGDPQVHFIGEYFGMDAGDEDFALLWTGTKTGVQELYCDVVRTKRIKCPHIPEIAAEILIGVTQDGGGWVLVGGKLHKVPPRSPLVAVLEELASSDRVETAAVDDLREALEHVAQDLGPG